MTVSAEAPVSTTITNVTDTYGADVVSGSFTVAPASNNLNYIGDYWWWPTYPQYPGPYWPSWLYYTPPPQVTVAVAPPHSGWACPRCSRVYAPQVTECKPCNKRAKR